MVEHYRAISCKKRRVSKAETLRLRFHPSRGGKGTSPTAGLISTDHPASGRNVRTHSAMG
jgi:hypothetical protein